MTPTLADRRDGQFGQGGSESESDAAAAAPGVQRRSESGFQGPGSVSRIGLP